MAEPITLTVTLDLDSYIAGRFSQGDPDLPDGPRTVEEVVLDLAAQQVATSVLKEDRMELRRRIQAIRDDEISDQVGPMIEEALAAAVQPTNAYGEPTGTQRTLREIIVAQATNALRESSRDGFGKNSGTLVERLVAAEVDKALSSELRKVIADAKTQTRALVAQKASVIVTDALERAAK